MWGIYISRTCYNDHLVSGFACIHQVAKKDSRLISSDWTDFKPGPEVIKVFFMLNSAEHEFILLINVKMPVNVGFGDLNLKISIIHTI